MTRGWRLLARTVAVAVALASCAPAEPSSAPVTPPVATPAPLPPPATRRAPSLLVAGALAEVGRARAVAIVHDVEGARVDRAELMALVRAHVAREVPTAAIHAEGEVAKLLGLFPDGGDYEAATYALFEDQLAGFYEPRVHTMFLAKDLAEPEAKATLWHELVHALQDQRGVLEASPLFVAGHMDRGNAASALAEGEATSVTEDLLAARDGVPVTDALDDDLASRMVESMDTGRAARVPPSLRREVLAPYVDGMRFVRALRKSGGWAAVDAAWKSPPVTTEQILHVDKWRAHEPELAVPDPPAPEGLSLVEANTYGEEEVRVVLAEWMSEARAARAASGWGGDRVGLFAGADGRRALLWHLRFDDASPEGDPEAFARSGFDAWAGAAAQVGRVVERSAEAVCVERPFARGVWRVARAGRDVFVAVAVGPGSPAPCRALGAWTAVAGRPG